MNHPYILNTRRSAGLSMSTLNRRRREHRHSHIAALAAVAMLTGALIALCIVTTLG